MAGRRSKYTPETVERILTAIRVGSTYEHAAQYGGIDGATFYRWQERYSEFREAITRVEADARMKWLLVIEKAASDGDWRAADRKLIMRYPQEYGRQALEVTGQGGGPLKIEVAWTDEKPGEGE
jgi:hypothetical protein